MIDGLRPADDQFGPRLTAAEKVTFGTIIQSSNGHATRAPRCLRMADRRGDIASRVLQHWTI
jgi:hypothetical protein